MKNKKGFTMVELLVVLVIVAILAAVATPIYLANVKRARASEAVGTMATIRQNLRDYQIAGATYFDIGAGSATGTITEALPTGVVGGTPAPLTAGVDIEDNVAQYFANTAFIVNTAEDGNAGASTFFTNPPIVDFLITANGFDSALAAALPVLTENNQCVGAVTNCATNASEVALYKLEMDNSGRVFVTYDGTNWESY